MACSSGGGCSKDDEIELDWAVVGNSRNERRNNVRVNEMTGKRGREDGEEGREVRRVVKSVAKVQNAEQKNKALKLQTICKKEVAERKTVGVGNGVRGVISGNSLKENLEELKKVIKGGEITGIRRLQAFRSGEKVDRFVSNVRIP